MWSASVGIRSMTSWEAGLGLRVLGFDFLEAAEIMGSSQTRFLSSTLLPFLFRGLPIQTKPD